MSHISLVSNLSKLLLIHSLSAPRPRSSRCSLPCTHTLAHPRTATPATRLFPCAYFTILWIPRGGVGRLALWHCAALQYPACFTTPFPSATSALFSKLQSICPASRFLLR